jgi:hypothetical protein
MNRICKSALLGLVVLGLGAGLVTACGGGDDHAGHSHSEGDGHDHPQAAPK